MPSIPRFRGDKLRFFRRLRGYSQVVLAEKAGINESTISSYERGRQEPSPAFAEFLAKALDVPPANFYCITELRAFADSQRTIEGSTAINPEPEPEPEPEPRELDSKALDLFETLPAMQTGISFTLTFTNESGWQAVPSTAAEALIGQGLEPGASVRDRLSIRMPNGDEKFVNLFGTRDIALDLTAIEPNAEVTVIAKIIYSSVLNENTLYLTPGQDGDVLYEDVSGFLVEKILEIHSSSNKKDE